MDYTEKLRLAKEALESGLYDRETIEYIFPELKESEDEIIRKEIIDYISKSTGCKRWVAWLEKQGEKSNTVFQPHKGNADNPYDMSFEEAQHYSSERGIDVPINDGDVFVDARCITQTIGNILRWADEHPKIQEKQGNNNSSSTEEISKSIVKNITSSLINYLDNNRYKGTMNMSSIECEDLEKAILDSDWSKVYRYMQKKLEKKGQEQTKVSIWKHWKGGLAGNNEGKPIYLIKDGTYTLSSYLSFECDYIELSELDNLMIEKNER